ncbi:MAG: heme-binding protein [Betaproteobacteria bacterium]|nr:MAG: heme-binding protein [Betaproteobacteria bacterium]
MKTKAYLTMADAKRIAAACEAEAVKNGWGVVIALTDDGGHLLWLQRLDGARPANSEIATLKARHAAINRRPSKAREDLILEGRFSLVTMPGLPVQGGLPIMYEGECIGAIGVSGVLSEEDTQVAQAGLAVVK